MSLRGAQRRSNPSQYQSYGFILNGFIPSGLTASGLLRGVYPERSVRARNDEMLNTLLLPYDRKCPINAGIPSMLSPYRLRPPDKAGA